MDLRKRTVTIIRTTLIALCITSHLCIKKLSGFKKKKKRSVQFYLVLLHFQCYIKELVCKIVYFKKSMICLFPCT